MNRKFKNNKKIKIIMSQKKRKMKTMKKMKMNNKKIIKILLVKNKLKIKQKAYYHLILKNL